MDQTTFFPHHISAIASQNEQETPIPFSILTFPQELLIPITALMNTKSYLALALTCKTLYGCYTRYKLKYKEKIFNLVCNLEYKNSLDSECIKALEHHIMHTVDKNGWAKTTKVTLEIISTDSAQNNCKYPIKALYLDGTFKWLNGLRCTSLSALIINVSDIMPYQYLNLPFLKQFSNLSSLSLNAGALNNEIISMVSKFPSLVFICLDGCCLSKYYLSKIFENCVNLEELCILKCNFCDFEPIRLSPLLKRFDIMYNGSIDFIVDASCCTRLEYM
jgi:hypothetical protein